MAVCVFAQGSQNRSPQPPGNSTDAIVDVGNFLAQPAQVPLVRVVVPTSCNALSSGTGITISPSKTPGSPWSSRYRPIFPSTSTYQQARNGVVLMCMAQSYEGSH